MKKIPLCLLACLLAFTTFGQYDKFLADPTVSWAAEIELLISPEESIYDWSVDSLNRSTVLKTVNTTPADKLAEDPELLVARLFRIMTEGRWPIADGGDPDNLISVDDALQSLIQLDTIPTFNQVTNEFKFSVFRNEIGPWNCPFVRVRQLLIYRDKTAEFDVVTRAVGPVLPNGKTVFWLILPEAAQTARPAVMNLDNPDIVWARQIKTEGASPDIAGLRSLKRPDLPLMRVFLHRVQTDSAVVVYDASGSRRMPVADRQNMYNRTDTLVTFDPETYEESVLLYSNTVKPDQIHQVRLIENWMWDEKRQLLYVRLVAVAPLAEVRDSAGELRFSRPLFYKKTLPPKN